MVWPELGKNRPGFQEVARSSFRNATYAKQRYAFTMSMVVVLANTSMTIFITTSIAAMIVSTNIRASPNAPEGDVEVAVSGASLRMAWCLPHSKVIQTTSNEWRRRGSPTNPHLKEATEAHRANEWQCKGRDATCAEIGAHRRNSSCSTKTMTTELCSLPMRRAQLLSNNCLGSRQNPPIWAKCSTNIGRCWQDVGRCWQVWAKFDQSWPMLPKFNKNDPIGQSR